MSTSDLAQRKCIPCTGGTPPLAPDQTREMLRQVPGWSIENGQLTRDIKVKNFRTALVVVNRIGELAEQEGHHPNICIHSWNHVKLELYTHSINGLSENDFILAAKINEQEGRDSDHPVAQRGPDAL